MYNYEDSELVEKLDKYRHLQLYPLVKSNVIAFERLNTLTKRARYHIIFTRQDYEEYSSLRDLTSFASIHRYSGVASQHFSAFRDIHRTIQKDRVVQDHFKELDNIKHSVNVICDKIESSAVFNEGSGQEIFSAYKIYKSSVCDLNRHIAEDDRRFVCVRKVVID